MKHLIIFLLILLPFMHSFAQNKSDFDTSTDAENGEIVFKGRITFNDLHHEPSFTWMTENVKDYTPSAAALEYLVENISGYEMVVFMGTWCSDSHNLIPKYEKMLDYVKYPVNKLIMYGTDRSKTTKNGSEKQYNITLVPTVIVLKNGKEVGRITETVNKSIEEDLIGIILGGK